MRILQLGAVAAATVLLLGCSPTDEDPAPEDPTPTGTAAEPPTEGATTDPQDPEEPTDLGLEDPPEISRSTVTLAGPEGSEPDRSIEVQIPDSWAVVDLGLAPEVAPDAGDPPQLWCLESNQDLPALAGCSGITVAIGGDWLPGEQGRPYVANQAAGWRPDDQPILCPNDPEAELDDDGEGNIVVPAGAEAAPLTSMETTVGDHLMRYETWRVTCSESDELFTTQVWQIRALEVLVRDYIGMPEAVAVLNSITPVAADADNSGTTGDTGSETDEVTDSPDVFQTGDTDTQTDQPTETGD